MARGHAFAALNLAFTGAHCTCRNGPPLRKIQEWGKLSQGRIAKLSILTSLAVRRYFLAHGLASGGPMHVEMLAALRRLNLREYHLEDMGAETLLSELSDDTRFVHRHLEALSMSVTTHPCEIRDWVHHWRFKEWYERFNDEAGISPQEFLKYCD